MIRLVVDSTCDIPASLIEKYGISVLPLFVTVNGKSYRDGTEISISELYGYMRQGILPKTSQVGFNDADGLFRSICDAGDDLIFLCFSSAMSGTFQFADVILTDLREEYPQRKLSIVDSEGGSFATGLIAMQTARWIRAGVGFEEVLGRMREMIAQVQHLFTLDSLNWLARGGRISQPVGYVGDILQVKPILHVADKTMHVIRVVRGRKAALKALVSILMDRIAGFPKQLIGITHADDLGTALKVEQMIHSVLPCSKTVVMPIGCVLGCHIGIGGVGLFFLKGPVAGYNLLDEDL